MPAEVNRDEVADRLHSASLHLLRRVRRVDSGAGVGPARLSALSVLVFGGPATVGRLAETEQVTPATMSRIVKGLADAGLVRKEPTGRDRRSVLVTPTAAGRRLMQAARRRRIRELAARLEGLSQRELATLARAAELMERAARSR